MSQQTFRSAFNGFNREDVVRYIEYLNAQHASEINRLNSELAFLRDQAEQPAPEAPENPEKDQLIEQQAARIRELFDRCKEQEQQIEQLKAESDATDRFVNLIKKYTVIDQLDAAILNELIDKIVVHHKEIAEDGRVFQQVEIYYRFIGKLENAAESKNAA